MTDEAGEIVARFRISMRGDALLPLRDAIESAINDAISVERERCAVIAEGHFYSDEYLYHANRCTHAIAAAIRKGDKQ